MGGAKLRPEDRGSVLAPPTGTSALLQCWAIEQYVVDVIDSVFLQTTRRDLTPSSFGHVGQEKYMIYAHAKHLHGVISGEVSAIITGSLSLIELGQS